MTDLEMTKLCAEAIGVEFNERSFQANVSDYDPLHEDAQAMALVKRFHLDINYRWEFLQWAVHSPRIPERSYAMSLDLNFAIVECVAQMQASK